MLQGDCRLGTASAGIPLPAAPLTGVPHFGQNALPSGIRVPHFLQNIFHQLPVSLQLFQRQPAQTVIPETDIVIRFP
jgi:hypothetical protein